MADMFDYLQWRGDILFSQMGVNSVDALVFASLAYVHYDDVAPGPGSAFITVRDAAQRLLALPDAAQRCRVPNDLTLLKAAAQTERFGRVGMTHYISVFDPDADTQFAGMAFLLEDGSAFLSFRGTDNTLVGWKEDFNMSFRDSVPAQQLAEEFVRSFAHLSGAPLYLGGHSKGGNLAAYAGAKCGETIQNRILQVYNHDGPGFTESMMTHEGYLRIVPKIKTFVPQSSVFGMLLEHKEPYEVIRSKHIGIMQHDPYTWEVMGGDFIRMEELTADSRFLDRTFDTWLAGMTPEERNQFFDAMFDLLMLENASKPKDILRPQNIKALFQTLQTDEERRSIITSVFQELAQAAFRSQDPQV